MSFVRRVIAGATKTPSPNNPGILVNGVLYISGQLGIEPGKNHVVAGGFEVQCRQALTNIGTVLRNAGGDYSSVVKVTVLLSDMSHFNQLNTVYQQFFSQPYPARSAYAVAQLPREGALVEIEAVAVIGNITEAVQARL